MGLLCQFDPITLGLDPFVETEVVGQVVSQKVDFSDACAAFVDAFLAVAYDLVPIRTGYLRSTINAFTDGWVCTAIASAEYAEYVEYGTSYMDEQPYFEPAIEAGLEAFMVEASFAYDFALEQVEAMAGAIMEAAMAATGGAAAEASLGQIFAGALLGAGLLFLLFPIFLGLYGVFSEIGIAFGGTPSQTDMSYLLDDLIMPEIEII